jgi:hypothetical protein
MTLEEDGAEGRIKRLPGSVLKKQKQGTKVK